MTYLENALCTELYHQQLDFLVQREIDSINSNRNRLFIADTIREVGLTNSIQKRFNANGELDHLFQMAGVESYGFSVSNEDLANAIIGTEGFTDGIKKMLRGLYTDIAKQFTAGYRWFQSLTDTSEEDINKINELLSQVDKNKNNLASQTIEAIDLSTVMSNYKQANTISNRAKACQYLEDLAKLDRFEDREILEKKANDIRATASSLSQYKSVISDHKKQTIKAQDVYRQVKSVAPILAAALKDIVKTNSTYSGFWKTGFAAGKEDAFFHLLIGWIATVLLPASPLGSIATGIGRGLVAGNVITHNIAFADIRSIASYSWSTISRATSIDYELCRMLMSNLKALNRLADR